MVKIFSLSKSECVINGITESFFTIATPFDVAKRICPFLSAIIFQIDSFGFLYLGRALNFPTALEGALKIKEISYMHAEGYGAGEMKHGPIALINPHLPVVCVAPESHVHEKMLSNIQEIRARRGIVISNASVGGELIGRHSYHVIYIPKVKELFSPFLTVVPLKLLAYYIAAKRGCDIDQPKNLAKSVTVE